MRGNGAVVALAGRRIDAVNASHERFPLRNVAFVGEQLQRLFGELDARALVCSAANGADLIALAKAHERNLPFRIVLPCGVERFRRESVTDRPDGQWGPLFDELVTMARSRGDLVIVGEPDGDAAGTSMHFAANARIIEEALHLAAAHHRTSDTAESHATSTDRVIGVAVWDGRSRGDDDITAAFVRRLEDHRIPVRHVFTLGPTATTSPSPP